MPEPTTEGSRLELVREPGGLRHYLAGRPVHAGNVLELQLEGGAWIRGRYEWSGKEDSPPMFFLTIAGSPGQASLKLPASAQLRWPGGARG